LWGFVIAIVSAVAVGALGLMSPATEHGPGSPAIREPAAVVDHRDRFSAPEVVEEELF